MAIITVNLTDTFDEWRIKSNTLGTNQGDLTTLSTTAKNTIVAAINEVFTNDSDDLENIVEDTSPQLGGNLDLNSRNITGTGQFAGTSIAGTVVGTTQSVGNNTTLLATTAFVTAQVATEDTLAEMNDTTIASPANLEILQYTGSVWENKTASAAGLPTTGFTIAMAVALG